MLVKSDNTRLSPPCPTWAHVFLTCSYLHVWFITTPSIVLSSRALATTSRHPIILDWALLCFAYTRWQYSFLHPSTLSPSWAFFSTWNADSRLDQKTAVDDVLRSDALRRVVLSRPPKLVLLYVESPRIKYSEYGSTSTGVALNTTRNLSRTGSDVCKRPGPLA